METHTVNIQGKLDQVSLQSPWGMGAQCNVKMKDGKTSQLQGSVKQYQSLGVEGALSRTGGLGMLGRVCCSLASAVWCQGNLSSCLSYFAADLVGGDLGRRCIRSLLGQRLGSGHGITGWGVGMG